MQLQYALDTAITIDGITYPLNLAFNTMLKIIDINNDEDLSLFDQLGLIYKLLFNFDDSELSEFVSDKDLENLTDIYNEITRGLFDSADEDEFDDEGNLVRLGNKSDRQLYDIDYDAKLIYAGFWQAYGIDLYEVHDELHWVKFKALLSGLPKDTRFAEVTSLRAWEPSKESYETAMRRSQRNVALPFDDEYFDEDEV